MRQDDPLSPYLFLLVQDSLSHLLNAGALSGDFKGIKIKRSCSPLSHLFFADDYIFFCEMEDSSINFLNEALAIYNSLASGQVINLDKSGISLSSNSSREEALWVSNKLGAKIVDRKIQYLSLPARHCLGDPLNVNGHS